MAALAATAGRYGYHRDELYFIAAGAHPAWGYPDQPLLAPLLARAMDLLASGSLLVLRAPAILACGLTTVTTGMLARELGGGRRAQAIAGGCWAAGAVCLVTGHFLTTTTYDVCGTAVVSLLICRVLMRREPGAWLPAGALLGLALLNKSMVGVVIAAVVIALAAFGPRAALRSRWLAAGAGLAVLGALPYALWQLAHGLPQQQLAQSIAQTGAEGGRAGFIPFQLVLIGPLVAPIWVAGLVALLRDRGLRPVRCFAVAYLALIPVLIATGGKAYYMAGLYPVLLGAGAVRAERWLGQRSASPSAHSGGALRAAAHGAPRALAHGALRAAAHGASRAPARGARAPTAVLAGAIVLTAAASAVIGLDVLPQRALQGSVVMSLNPDSGETVGWPRFVHTVASVYDALPASARARTTIFTDNYGEAGAIAHFGPALGLPYPHSGHNGWWLWGPPPDRDTVAILVGLDRVQAAVDFTGCRLRARIDDGVGLDNQEQGAPVLLCAGERRPWSALWPALRHYD